MTHPTSPPSATLERAREFLVRWPPHIARSATEVELRDAALTDLAQLLTEERTKALSEREAEIERLREALASAELTIERQNRRIDLLDMPANGAAWLDRNGHPKW